MVDVSWLTELNLVCSPFLVLTFKIYNVTVFNIAWNTKPNLELSYIQLGNFMIDFGTPYPEPFSGTNETKNWKSNQNRHMVN